MTPQQFIVWIGELQWRMAHGYEFKTNPILEPLEHIECRDALLSFTEPTPLDAVPVEATWPIRAKPMW
jgi:hypothetical protein